MNKALVVLGAGGHARVLADALRAMDILGFADVDPSKLGSTINGSPVIDDREIESRYPASDVVLVNGLGTVGASTRRKAQFDRFKRAGYAFMSVRHTSAIVAADVQLGEGTQVMAGAILQTGVSVGSNAIINTRASVDHDCLIGAHVHIAPGAVLSGGVQVGEGAHIGTGAVVIQQIRIGANSTVAAGAVVVRDVPEGATVMGNPARESRT